MTSGYAINGIEAPDSVLISVIIPALNEEAMIGGCLESLAKSKYPVGRFEVIVADNGSRDRTVQIAESFAERLRITILNRPGVTVSELRNMGAAVAQGIVLAFLDADCQVPGDWLQKAEQHLCEPSAGIVGGYIAIPQDSRWIARVWYGLGYAPKTGDVSYVPSGNLLVRRSCFAELRGFRNDLRTAEDFDLCIRARRAGRPVRGVADMAVLHRRTPQYLREFYIRERWHGAHVGLALLKNVGEWADFRAFAFAVYMLVCVLGILGGVGYWLVSQHYMILLMAVMGVLAGSMVCSLLKLRRARRCNRRFLAFLQLTMLHVIYGLARARALISAEILYPRGGTSSLKEDTSWQL